MSNNNYFISPTTQQLIDELAQRHIDEMFHVWTSPLYSTLDLKAEVARAVHPKLRLVQGGKE